MSKKTKEIKCIHRHTINDHPKCFAKGLVKYKDDRQFEKETGLGWYNYPDYRIGYFDIESDGLFADFGTMLTWCIKEKGGKITYDIIEKEDLFNGLADYNLTKSLINEIRKYKIICTYYGTGFDFPFLRAKALHYGLDFPGYGDIYHFDLYYVARDKLRLTRKSLDNVCDYLKIEGKTQIDKDAWRKAKYGDPVALQEVLSHNSGDVVILEELHNKLESFRKWTRRSI